MSNIEHVLDERFEITYVKDSRPEKCKYSGKKVGKCGDIHNKTYISYI